LRDGDRGRDHHRAKNFVIAGAMVIANYADISDRA
jgi:hypothetical protein